jgi:hypothetical protein
MNLKSFNSSLKGYNQKIENEFSSCFKKGIELLNNLAVSIYQILSVPFEDVEKGLMLDFSGNSLFFCLQTNFTSTFNTSRAYLRSLITVYANLD